MNYIVLLSTTGFKCRDLRISTYTQKESQKLVRSLIYACVYVSSRVWSMYLFYEDSRNVTQN